MPSTLKLALVSMPFFLAESTYEGVKSSALGEWLVQAAAAAVLVMALWNLVDRVRGGTPQKREVSFTEEFATKKQHEELKLEVAKIDTERRVSVANLHTKIDDNTKITAETRGKLDLVNQQLAQLNQHLLSRGN